MNVAGERAKGYVLKRLLDLGSSPYLNNYRWKTDDGAKVSDSKVEKGRHWHVDSDALLLVVYGRGTFGEHKEERQLQCVFVLFLHGKWTNLCFETAQSHLHEGRGVAPDTL